MPSSDVPLPKISKRIFVSYRHVEEDYLSAKALHGALEGMCRRLGHIPVFVDFKTLLAGDVWEDRILGELEQASVFIVLLSHDYLTSSFCRDTELRRILERREADHTLRVIGVALHDVTLADFFVESTDGRRLGIDRYQCLPQGMRDRDTPPAFGLKPISHWSEGLRRDAWHQVVVDIEKALAGTDLHQLDALQGESPRQPLAPAGNPQADWLPYLCNREPQYQMLTDPLHEWKKSLFRRPLVLVSEGRHREDCLYSWVDRLYKHELPRALGGARHAPSFGHSKPVRWPVDAVVKPEDGARRHFQRSLAAALFPNGGADDAALAHSLLTRGRASLLWLECSNTLAPTPAKRAFQGLLDVLSALPDLGCDNALLIAVNLVRDSAAAADKRVSKLHRDFDKLLATAKAQERVQGAMLGLLTDVDDSDVKEWASQDFIQPHLVSSDIDSLIRRLPRGQWPMADFVDAVSHPQSGWFKAS